MLNPISSILRSATRENNEPLNVLTAPTHERYQASLASTNAQFYLWRSNDGTLKDWEPKYAPLPANHTLLDSTRGTAQIPDWLDIDLVLSQNRFGQFQILDQIAKKIGVPHINIEHTLPMPNWDSSRLQGIKGMKADINIFISEFSRDAWGWGEDEAKVIHHGIDTNTFRPLNLEKKPVILATVNKYQEREYICGFDILKQVTQGLPVKVLGDNPGLSEPAELVKEHNRSTIFLNTSRVSPIPMSLLEGMSCLIEGEWVFYNYQAIKIEDLINLQTTQQNTRGDKILKKYVIDYNDEIFSIKCNYIKNIKVTKNHPIATVEIENDFDPESRKRHTNRYKRVISDIIWKEAKDIKINDWIVVPKLKIEEPTGIDKDWMRFYGTYLAEGNTSKGNICITLNVNEKDKINEIVNFAKNKLDRNCNIRKLKDEQCIQIIFTHAVLARELNRMFHGLSHVKCIPDEFMKAPKEEIWPFIEAYLEGDGTRVKGRRTKVWDGFSYSCRSSSHSLIVQLSLLLTKFDIIGGITPIKEKIGIIRGRTFKGKSQSMLTFSIKYNNSKKMYREDENNFYVKVKEITKLAYVGKVYNLSTESNTFTAPFALVHNCGNIVVSTATCMIPEIIKNGYNGYITNDLNQMRNYLIMILNNPEQFKEIGMNARKTILERFSLDKFVQNWDNIFRKAAQR
jgi:intein/homing endonuclease